MANVIIFEDHMHEAELIKKIILQHRAGHLPVNITQVGYRDKRGLYRSAGEVVKEATDQVFRNPGRTALLVDLVQMELAHEVDYFGLKVIHEFAKLNVMSLGTGEFLRHPSFLCIVISSYGLSSFELDKIRALWGVSAGDLEVLMLTSDDSTARVIEYIKSGAVGSRTSRILPVCNKNQYVYLHSVLDAFLL